MSIQVFEWKIENFSCWCKAVHGRSIPSPEFFFLNFRKARLYPRGVGGQEDELEVRFSNVRRDIIGEASFIGFDGSLISTQQMIIRRKGISVPGPTVRLKFEEMAAQIRKANQKDQITLRFCIQSVRDDEQRMMCTTIGVWKESFKVDPKLIESDKSDNSKYILYFRYTSNLGTGIHLEMARLDGNIKLTMQPHGMPEKSILVESVVSMLSSDNDLVRNEANKHVFTDKEAWVFSESLTVRELEEKGIIILLGLKVINGDIVQRYNYSIKDEKVDILPTTCFCEQGSSVFSNQSSTELKKELLCLFQDKDFCDFQLKCDNVAFPVHRAILSARSPVFKTMLSCGMKEASSGIMHITDLDVPTLSSFLTFLYTGTLEDLQSDTAFRLYYAADKYQVPSLKRECARCLSANLSVENVLDVLDLAGKHNDNDLFSASHIFILKNYTRFAFELSKNCFKLL